MNDITNLHDPDDPEMTHLLRQALNHEANSLHPGDRLDSIKAQARTSRRPAVLAVVAATAVLVVASGLMLGILLPRTGPVDTAAPASNVGGAAEQSTVPSSPTAASRSAPSASVASSALVPVYWIGRDGRLYREFLPGTGTGSRAERAVMTMLTRAPLDPDYTRGPWRAVAKVSVVQSGDDLIVDLPSDALRRDGLTANAASVAIQQLVYTVTAATLAQGSVTILVDGKRTEAWAGAKIDAPIPRDVGARSPVWITNFTHDATVAAGQTRVTVNATAFEGSVNWSVTRADGTVLSDGSIQCGANGTFADCSFNIALDPGRYMVSVFTVNMDTGRTASTDTKTILVV